MAGWVVGKSDFNENPVVSLDLDLDLDFDLGFVKISSLNQQQRRIFDDMTERLASHDINGRHITTIIAPISQA